MIAIIDYGAGNIFSVKNALDFIGVKSMLTDKKEDIENADGIILPGVGAFPWAVKKLGDSGLIDTLKTESQKKPLLGICLGMQLLFDKSYEFEETNGLSLIPGEVKLMDVGSYSLPHIGWNKLEINRETKLLHNVGEAYVYFVHSYAAITPNEYVCAYCDYAGKRTALVNNGLVYGSQFHPEKSGNDGLQIYRNFAEIVKNGKE